jgi:hypothetical protein
MVAGDFSPVAEAETGDAGSVGFVLLVIVLKGKPEATL